MTVEGTQQRVYGVIRGDCYIDLQRFAWVYGSTIDDPSIYTGTIYYGNVGTYAVTKPCSDSRTGNLTLLFTNTQYGSPFVAVEVRLCEDELTIEVWSYGIAAAPVDSSLWYNDGSRSTPVWVKLNAASASVLMAEASAEFEFDGEPLNDDEVYFIEGCDHCGGTVGTPCIDCPVPIPRFYVKNEDTGVILYGSASSDPGSCPHASTGVKYLSYGYKKLGSETLIFDASRITSSDLPITADDCINNEPYGVYYIDDLNVHHLLETYSKFELSCDCWDIFVEYTINCDTIDINIYKTDEERHICFAFYRTATSRGLEFAGMGWIPCLFGGNGGLLTIKSTSIETDFQIDGSYYCYGWTYVDDDAVYNNIHLHINGGSMLSIGDGAVVKSVTSDGIVTTIGTASVGYSNGVLFDEFIVFGRTNGNARISTVATIADLPDPVENRYRLVTSTNTLWFSDGIIWRNSGLQSSLAGSINTLGYVYDTSLIQNSYYTVLPRIPYVPFYAVQLIEHNNKLLICSSGSTPSGTYDSSTGKFGCMMYLNTIDDMHFKDMNGVDGYSIIMGPPYTNPSREYAVTHKNILYTVGTDTITSKVYLMRLSGNVFSNVKEIDGACTLCSYNGHLFGMFEPRSSNDLNIQVLL